MKFIVRKTIDCNESEMNENGPQGCLQFKRLKARLLLSIQSVEISRLLPEKRRSMLGLNEVKRNFDGSLKAF